MKLRTCSLLLLLALLFSTGCKEKYEPSLKETNLSYLVVDGFLNNSADTTFIRLSRTRKVSEGTKNTGEQNALVTIEDLNGNVLYHFEEINSDGTYIIPGINLDAGNKYRLRITTSKGKQYLSDALTVVKTPPIDSISWSKNDKGVTIYANTHDSQNNTKYYRWDYVETWKYRAAYASTLKYENQMVVTRPFNEYFWECWRTVKSSQLLLSSSAKLTQDVISNYPVRFIEQNGYELSILYSILLKQYALTRESFEYLENLKKITEQTGSIFDSQPSQLTGNIHDVNDPDEPVLGFLTISSEETKRIFISNNEVLPWFLPFPCVEIEIIPPIQDSIDLYFGRYGYIPTRFDGYPPKGVFATTAHCADCRFGGGITAKPDFWP
jgi:uncharacterized protein DUF4249